MKKNFWGLSFLFVFLFSSCSSLTPQVLYFDSDRQDIQLYVNDEFIGEGNGSYYVQPGEREIIVSCRENGIQVLTKNIRLSSSSGNYYKLHIPQNMNFGSGLPNVSRSR